MIEIAGKQRGYFGIGVDRMSKAMNMGALMRTAHAFGASFFFTLGSNLTMADARQADTSQAALGMPFYRFDDVGALELPLHCQLIGVELTEDAVDLPTFYHPPAAAYVLGPEWGSLAPEVIAVCKQVVRIPTRFCVNVSVAGAILMYDRMLATSRFATRTMSATQQAGTPPAHLPGDPPGRKKSP